MNLQTMEKKKSNNLMWAVILLLTALIFTGVGAVGYWVYDTQIDGESKEKERDDTISEDSDTENDSSDEDVENENDLETDTDASWKVYTNTTGYGYQFKYPNDAEITTPETCQDGCEEAVEGMEETSGMGGCGPCFSTRVTLQGYDYPFATLQVESYANIEYDLQDEIDSMTEDYSWKSSPVEKDIEIGGVSAKLLEGVLDWDGEDRFASYIVVLTDNYYHVISWWDEEDSPNSDVYEYMIDSWEFEE